MRNQMLKRVLAMLLCAVMLAEYVPMLASAAEEDGLCEHHTAHTDCGYEAGVSECGYVCEVCDSESSESTPATEAPAQPATEPVQSATEPAGAEEMTDEEKLEAEKQAAVEKSDSGSAVMEYATMTLSTPSASCEWVLQASSGYPESAHNYANNMSKTYTYQVAGADFIKLVFSSSTFVESNYDFIYIYDGTDTQIKKSTGGDLASATVVIPGDTVKIKLTSDGSVTKYGFAFTGIYAGYEQTLKDLTLSSLPAKTLYGVGDTLDLTGLTLIAEDSSGNEKFVGVDDGITVGAVDTSTVGRKTVTVTYMNLQVTFEIGVHVISSDAQLQPSTGYPESDHKYSKNTDKTYTYTVSGATSLVLTFSSGTETESGYDYIYIYDGADTELGKYTGTALSSKTITVTGDTVKIRLTSDGSEQEYGFALTSIYAYNAPVHEPDGDGVYTPHTCTANAYTTYSCKSCDLTWKETHANTAAHSWDSGVYTDPTCTADGYTTKTCAACGKTEKTTDTGSKLGHDLGEGVYTAPTCIADAFTTYTCTRCTYSTVETHADTAEGHMMNEGVYTESDCFDDGYTTYTCEICGATETQTDEGTAGHFFDGGECMMCGVPEDLTAGDWIGDSRVFWAMLPGNVLYIGGIGEVPSNSSYRSQVTAATSVQFGPGITGLGSSALYGLTKLTKVDIPANITSIGNNAFYNCTALRSIYIPATVTSIPASYYSYAPFLYCSTSLRIYCEAASKPAGWGSYWDNQNTGSGKITAYFGITRQEYDFWSTLDTATTHLVIPDYVTSVPKGILYNRDNLRSVVIGAGVKSIGDQAFQNCSNLQYVYIPTNVTAIGSYPFDDCSSSLKLFCEGSAASGWGSSWNEYDVAKDVYFYHNVPKAEFDYWSQLSPTLTSVAIPEGITFVPGQAFYSFNNLQSVTFSDSVTTICLKAFDNRDKLTAVTLGAGVTRIETGAFYDCDGLRKVYIPETVTSITAGSYSNSPFYECSSSLVLYCGAASKPSGWGTYWNYYSSGASLKTVFNMPPEEYTFWTTVDLNRETVEIPEGITTVPDGTFQNLTTLKKVVVPDSVVSIGKNAFSGCTALAEVTLSDNLTSISDYAFYGCTALTEFAIPGSVETIGTSAFSGCTALTKVNIPVKVTSIGTDAFYNCSALDQVTAEDLSAWCAITFKDENANPLYYGDLYLEGQKVTDLVIPEGVTAIPDYAFNCATFTSVTLPTTLLTVGYGAFNRCETLTAVHVKDLAKWCGVDFESYTANPLYYGDLYLEGERVTDVEIPEGVTQIARYAFSYPEMTSVSFPTTVESVGYYAFYQSSKLEGVYITDLSAWCAIAFNDANANPLYQANHLYVNNELLTSLTIPDRNTYVGKYTFAGCDDLLLVIVPSNVKQIHEGAFYACDGLLGVSTSEGLEVIGKEAFYSCDAMSSFEMPATVKTLGKAAFNWCSSLTSVSIPGSVATIPDDIFYMCEKLEAVTLGEGIVSIGGEAFRATALTEIRIPSTVKNIYSWAFHNCTNLTSIYFAGDAPKISSDTFKYVTADAYYPATGAGWNETTLVNYGGTLSWKLYSVAGTVASGTCGSDVKWLLDKDGTLIISGTGAMYSYSGYGTGSSAYSSAPWNSNRSDIKKVIIDKGVTSVGSNAFYGCVNLEQIDFYGDFPTFYSTSLRGFTGVATYRAANATWIPSALGTYGGSGTWKPVGMSEEYLAYSDSSFTREYWKLGVDGTLYLYNWSASYSVAGAPWYSYRNHIKKVIFDGNMSPDVGSYSFYGCTELTAVEIRSNYTTYIGKSAFDGCTKLKYVDLGDDVYSIGNYAFSNCSALESIFLPQDHYGSEIGDYAFSYCTSLQEATIPACVTLGSRIFYGCPDLRDIYISENSTDSYFYAADDSFTGVTATVRYPMDSYFRKTSGNYGGTITWVASDYGTCGMDAKWRYDSEAKKLTIYGTGRLCGSYFGGSEHPWGGFNDEILSIVVGEGITFVPSYTFEHCSAVTSVVLPESLTQIELNAFNNCESMNNLILPSSLESFGSGYASSFIRCYKLTDVYYFGTEAEWDALPGSEDVISYDSEITLHFLELTSDSATCTEPGVEDYYRYDDISVYDAYYDSDRNVIAQPVEVPALGHDWETVGTFRKVCSRCAEEEWLIEPTASNIFKTAVKHSALYKDKIQLQFHFSLKASADDIDAMGALIWTKEEYEAELDAFTEARENKTGYTSEAVYATELKLQNGLYRADNEGQKPRELHQVYYAVPYVVIGDTYIYGEADEYSAMQYADEILTKSTNLNSRAAVEGMMRYAKFTQLYLQSLNGGDAYPEVFDAVLTKHNLSTDVVWTAEDESLLVATPTVQQPAYSDAVMAWAGGSVLMKDETFLCYVLSGKATENTEILYWAAAAYAAAGDAPVKGTQTGMLTVQSYDSRKDQAPIRYTSVRLSGNVYYARVHDTAADTYGPVRADSITALLTRTANAYVNNPAKTANLNFARAYLQYIDVLASYLGTN